MPWSLKYAMQLDVLLYQQTHMTGENVTTRTQFCLADSLQETVVRRLIWIHPLCGVYGGGDKGAWCPPRP